MKKILSLALAGVMMFSALPMAYAADVDYKTGTNVTVVGDGGEYFVTVPASLEPGQTGTVRAYGKWASNETVKVTTDATVEVEHQETGAKTNVNVTFAGIESLGNDLEDMDVTANISIDKGDIRFGEWKGVIEYNVEFDDGVAETVVFYDTPYLYESSDSDSYKPGWWIKLDTASGAVKLCTEEMPNGMSVGNYTAKGQTITTNRSTVFYVSEDGYTITMSETLGNGTVSNSVWKYTP